MNGSIGDGKIENIFNKDGIEVYTLKTNKFKTGSINVYFIDNLVKENVSKNALIPYVLKRGSKNFPSIKDINLKLEELFGASFESGIMKKGELQIVQFYVDFISEIYLKEEQLFNKIVGFLFDVLTNPILDEDNKNSFSKGIVNIEKENLIKKIKGRLNDKLIYAADRCLEEMCDSEPYAIYEYGSTEKIEEIESEELYDYYHNYFLKRLPIKIFISGEFKEESIKTLIDKLSQIKRGEVIHLKPAKIYNKVEKIKEITENLSVNQGKLSLGFRTNIPYIDNDYKALMVYNSILGGGIHSKLFANVREKESLAYYASSRLDKFKSLQLIISGIEIANKDKAYNIILEQIDDLKKGNITDYEYESSIASLETAFNYLKDTQISIIDFYLGQIILNSKESIDDIINKIKKVKKEDVIKVSKKVIFDTMYFLTAKEDRIDGSC